MSIVKETVLEKVVLYLKSGLENVKERNKAIRVMVDERVPPDCPEEFIGVYGGEVSTIDPPHNVMKHHNYAFVIGITRRVLTVPNEQAGEYILTYNDQRVLNRTKPSMFARANEIVELLEHNDGWTLLSQINSVVGPVGCFMVPFGFVSLDSQPETVGPDHFDSEPSQGTSRYFGLFMPLTFGGAEYFKSTSPPA